MKKKIFILVVFLFSLFALVGCGQPVEGPQGPAGAKGANGKSAYEIAVENGFNGTEEAWLESLHGEDGEPGLNGLQGPQGEQGPAGEPAKEIELFAEDGGVYWRLAGEEDAELLYYYLDYITVSYREPVLYSSFEEIRDAFFADAKAKYVANSGVEGAEDLTLEDFWDVKAHFMDFSHDAKLTPAEKQICDAEFLAKWGWFIAYVDSLIPTHIPADMGTYEYAHTCLIAYGLAYGTPKLDSSGNGTKYSDELLLNSVNNFLNRTDDHLSGANSSYNVAPDFTGDKGLDGLMEAYLEGIQEIKEEHVSRVAYSQYELLDDEDAAVAATFDPEKYFFDGWVDEDGEEVTGVESNHSIVVYLNLKKKTAVNLEFDGGFSTESLKAAVQAAFLADINAVEGFEDVTAENFYTKFADKFMAVTAVDPYVTSGFCKDHPEFLTKWTWFIEYIAQVMGDKKYGNTAIVAFGLHSANDSNVVTSSLEYADRTVTNSISNFFNGVKTNLHGGGSSGNVPADFTSASAYTKLVAAVPAEVFAGLTLPNTKEDVIVAYGLPSLTKDGMPLVGWYLKDDAEKVLVAPEAMEDGKTYVALYLDAAKAAEAEALFAAFLADVNEALGKSYTAQGLYDAFRSGDNDLTLTEKFFMGVIADGDNLVKTGVMVGHEDVIAKHAYIFEYIAKLMKEDGKSHKYEFTAMSLFGITVPEGAKVETKGSAANKYFNRCLVVQLVNLLRHTNEDPGEGSDYPPVDFADPNNWCLGLLAFKAEYDAAHPAA
ncbi:MAG: collagen-like protein [Bacilli bacterium]|nr:collagen-like protein [Bacilli bacterium]